MTDTPTPVPAASERNVSSIPDLELLRRAVTNACNPGKPQPRYGAVMCVFGLGSTFAWQLCKRFDLDPEEIVK